jgi:ubiquitin-protein ligase
MRGLFNKGNKNRSAGQQDPKKRSERLLIEYDRIFKCFRTHPYISVKEVFGTPPEKYHFLYRVDGLVHTGKSIESKTDHVIEITLPANYPDKEPVCKALTPIFHPNISPEAIDIKQLLTPGIFLADLVVRIGELIVFQRYFIDDPLNVGASQWAARNKSILPISSVNLNYTLPQEAPDTALVEDLVQKPSEASKASETSKTEDSATAGDAKKTESIFIESDSARIKLDHEMAPASDTNPKDLQIEEISSAEEGKKTEAINFERDTPETGKTVSMFVQTPAEKEVASDNRSSGESIEDNGIGSERSSHHLKKTRPVFKNDTYCPFCGNRNSNKANFCIYCGTKLATKPNSKSARTFFLASMIAVPAIIIGAGISAIFFHLNGSGLPKMFLFQTFPFSASNLKKVEREKPLEPAPYKDSVFVNAAHEEGLRKTETAPLKTEKTVAVDKSSNPNKSGILISKQRPIKDATEPVINRKTRIDAASGTPVRSKRTIEKPNAENAAPRAGNEQQKIQKTNNMLKLARLYVGIGSYDDAIAQYLDVLRLDPTNQEARDGLVKARETKKNTLGK